MLYPNVFSPISAGLTHFIHIMMTDAEHHTIQTSPT